MISVDFRPSIRAYAEAHLLDLNDEATDSLDVTLRSLMKVDGDRVSFVTGNGQTGDLDAAIELYSAGTPRRTTTTAPIGNTATATAMQKVRDARAGQTALAAQVAAAAGNPWKPGPTFNRTNQSILINTDPQLAARLRTQAGA